jgi:hypothetical protein
LIYWEPTGEIDAETRVAWEAAAGRIASGLRVLAHLPTTVDPESFTVAFSCETDHRLAARYVGAIGSEHIEARLVRTGNDDYGVAVPCRPDATDEEIKHVVLAGVKAAHALEFIPIDDPDILAQLQLVRAIEACLVDFGRSLKRAGSRLRRGGRTQTTD